MATNYVVSICYNVITENNRSKGNIMDSIWKTLSSINVNDHTETKGKFTYLSWAWAWAAVKKEYPAAKYKFLESKVFPDSTMEIWCSVSIEELTHEMWLPVMNHQNKAIANPNAMDINKTRMRCLVKCLAMFGLGHYIYAGEDLPDVEPEPYTPEQKATFDMLVANEDDFGFWAFWRGISDEAKTGLYNSFEKGNKVKGKEAASCLEKTGLDKWNNFLEALDGLLKAGDDAGVYEYCSELAVYEKQHLARSITEDELMQIKEIVERIGAQS